MDISKLNLLITGGCGFIGSNFCNYIQNRVNKLVIIDKLDYICNEKNINNIIKKENVFFIKDDLLKHDLINTFKKYDINYIIHFAAQTHVDNSYLYFKNFINDNIIATYNLLNSIHIYNNNIKLIHFSTDEIYGSSNDKLFTEESNFNPTNPYSSTKASCEMIINTYKYTYKLPIIITRCNNVYGKYQYYEKVIPLFIYKALNNEILPIHGDGRYIRDFIHIDDVINALITIMNNNEFGEIYNIGNDNPITIIDLAKKIINKLGKGNIEYVKDRAFNDFRYPLDFSKLEKIGWKSIVNFDDGLNETINWYLENKNYFNEIKGRTFTDVRGKLQMLPVPDTIIKQQLISTNKKNVLRGIHRSPNYGKHIVCIKGSFIDYVIDYDTLTYKKYYLSSDNLNKIYVPPNYGHAFISLEDDSTMFYQIEGCYDELNDINYNYLCPYVNLDIPFENDYILSEKDKNAQFLKPVDYIILGSTGFLGTELCKIFDKQKKNYIKLNTRIQNYYLLEKQLKFYKPKYIINATGAKFFSSNWCDDNQKETVENNLTYQLVLADICNILNIKLIYFVSGIIYNNTNKLMNEDDIPDNYNSYYSSCRIELEKILKPYMENILLLRICYPISFTDNKKCLINKLKNNLNNINDVEINITILPDLFEKLSYLIEDKNVNGILNFVNKDSIKLNELLNLLNINNYNIDNNIVNNSISLLNTTKLDNLLDNKLNTIIDSVKLYK